MSEKDDALQASMTTKERVRTVLRQLQDTAFPVFILLGTVLAWDFPGNCFYR